MQPGEVLIVQVAFDHFMWWSIPWRTSSLMSRGQPWLAVARHEPRMASHDGLWQAMAGHCRPWPVIVGDDQPWPAMTGHGWPWHAMTSHVRPFPGMVGHGWLRPLMLGHC